MAAPPLQPLLLTNYTSLVQTFVDFLIVSIHSILYTRSIYPASTFISTRVYNFPVRQNRHPKVCQWIIDACSAVQGQLLQGVVRRVAVVIYNQKAQVMERWIFDVDRFPIVPKEELLTEFAEDETGKGRRFSVVDVEEQLRATARKLAYCGEKMAPLPENCTYTVAVELKDKAEPPIGHPQPWVPSMPSLQTGAKGKSDTIGSDLGGVRSVPVRAVAVGEFLFEAWVEEGKAKESSDG